MDFGFRCGSLRGYFLDSSWKKGVPFCIQFCRSLLERLRGLFNMIWGSVLEGFWGGLGPGKSCQSVQLYAFSGFGPFWSGVCFRIRFWKGSGMHLGRFGADWGTHWEPVGFCFSVWVLPLWHVDVLCFSDGFRDLSKSTVGQKLMVITSRLEP